MTGLDVAILAAYVIGVTLFGCSFLRQSSTTDGFVAANRNLPGWLVGLSIFGTYLSSISFLALPGKAYAADWNVFAFSLSLPIAAFVAVKWFAPLYRATADVSAYAYLERRFGYWARAYAGACYLLTQVARIGTILFLVALALTRLTGWPIEGVIVAAGAVVILYTVVGGIEAVIWTDAVQSAILTAGAAVCAFLLLFGTGSGPAEVVALAAGAGKFSLGSWSADFTTSTFWTVFVYGLVINLQNFGIDQSYVQRYQTARSLAAARRAVWVGALAYVPVSALFLFIGSALFSYYTVWPGSLPAGIEGDQVFPHFIVTELPAGARGLLIAALFAAAMSSVDSSLNSSATILLTDLYVRHLAPFADDRRRLRFVRIVTVALGVVGTGAALAMISIRSALDVWWQLAGLFSGGMLGLFLLGALSRRADAPRALAAVAAGLLVITWSTFGGEWLPAANPLHPLMTAVTGTVTIFAVGALLSRGRPPRRSAAPPLTIHDLGEERP